MNKFILATLVFLVAVVNGSVLYGSQDRFAVCHDGNYNDKDDIGAIAMVEALVWKAGVQNNLVHLSHSSHIGANWTTQHEAMIVSANRGAWLYRIAHDKIWDDHWSAGLGSLYHLAHEINLSSPTNRLTIIQGGPWEMMARSFDASDPTKHQYVDIISHSIWNDNYQYEPTHRNKVSFFSQYFNTTSPLHGYSRPTYKKIQDQNATAFNSDINDWDWMTLSLRTHFVLWRTIASGYAEGDMSDAGMLFYYLTGNEYPVMQDIRDFFEL